MRVVKTAQDCSSLLFNKEEITYGNEQKNKDIKVSENIYGRITTWRRESHRKFLVNVRHLFGFVFGHDTYEHFLSKGLNAKELMCEIGLTEEYIEERLQSGYKFDLIVFEGSSEVKPISATWEGIGEFFSRKEDYPPELLEIYQKYFEVLKTTKFEDIENSSEFFQIWKDGKNGEKYMDLPRLMNKIKKQDVSLSDLRLYLYLEMCLNEVFNGDGHTIDSKTGKRGFKEYLVKNFEKSKVKSNLVVVTLEV